MAIQDDLALAGLRLAAVAPSLSQAPSTVLQNLMWAFLSANAETAALITTAQQNMFLASASGAALDTVALNYNVRRNQGTAATAGVTFAVPSFAGQAITIPTNVIVATPGDGLTIVSQTFATQSSVIIPQGGTTTDSNQTETITITGTPTGGTFTLQHAGQTTAAIAYNATATQVASALQALSNVGLNSVTNASNVACGGGPLPGTPVTVTWQGNLGGLPFSVMTATDSLTGGTSPTVGVAITSASAPQVTAQAILPGTAGNVGASQISVLITTLGSGITVTNTSAATGGVDADTDAVVRSTAYAAMAPKYGAVAVQAEALGVSGVYDCYVYDPQNGNGTIKVYWSDVDGTTPGLSGDTQSSGTITAGTLAAEVQTAVGDVLPPNLIAYYAPFVTINTITAISVQVSAPAAYSTTYLTPLVQAAVAAYVQALVHDEVPTSYGMGQYVGAYAGLSGVITNFVIASSTPSISGAVASDTTLWRLSGTPSQVVTVSRV